MPRRNSRPQRRRNRSLDEWVWTERELSTEQMAARLVLRGLASPLILNDATRGTKDSVRNLLRPDSR